MEITTKVPGATNLLAALCRELRIAEYVNQMVPWDEKQCKVSPGTLVAYSGVIQSYESGQFSQPVPV